MFKCDHCGESFTQKCHVNRHIISVHERKEYECDHCDYTANRKDNIKRHMKSKHSAKRSAENIIEPNNKKRRKDDWGDGDITA